MWRDGRHNRSADADEETLLSAHGSSAGGTMWSWARRHRMEIVAACCFLCGCTTGTSILASMRLGKVTKEETAGASQVFSAPVPLAIEPLAVTQQAHTRNLLRSTQMDGGAKASKLPATSHHQERKGTRPRGDEAERNVSLPSVARPRSGRVRMWQTARDLGRWEQQADAALVDDHGDFVGPVIDISQEEGQTLVGFGGAFTEASAKVYKKLKKEQQEQVIADYFSEEGLGYTVGRVHINSCDFSEDHYSFDDTQDDFALADFDSAATHDTDALIPFISLAQQTLESVGRSLRLLASPWSPPAWMKANGKMDHSSRPCLKEGAQEAWASYISKWISAYKAQGVPIWAVTVQNEPENDARWEACMMTPKEEADFVGEQLGPALSRSHPEVLIFGYDHNKDHIAEWADTLYEHKSAAKYTDGIAFHWYSGDGFTAVDQVRRAHPEARLLASEATYERYRFHDQTDLEHGDWSFGEGYAHDILGDLNAGSIGWIDWNLLLDQDGGPNHADNPCDSALMADVRKSEVYRHPQFYFVGHFSKYLLPGSKHLRASISPERSYTGEARDYGTCRGEDGLQVTAARRPDGLMVAVVLNCGDDPIGFQLKHQGKAFVSTIPPHAIQTYLVDPVSSDM